MGIEGPTKVESGRSLTREDIKNSQKFTDVFGSVEGVFFKPWTMVNRH